MRPGDVIGTLAGRSVEVRNTDAEGRLVLGDALVRADRRAHGRAWPMPLLEEYASVLDSDVADLRNLGGRNAGATVAACFLHRFARGLRWAHLDVAGTATEGGGRGASGRPVPLLARYLIDRAAGRYR